MKHSKQMPPEIAIIGHPNEGKSSVLSTLAEDDSVRISPIPGETSECRTFPVRIDNKEVLRFTDTPGFQNPQRLLAELKNFSGNSESRLQQLSKLTGSQPEFKDDHELMLPIERGAGIIYVADGSRPVRGVDRAEMEILRLLGRPRMAVINCKNNDHHYLDDWKDEFRKHFNSSRIFNAHRATYAERIELLESLKAIDQDWHQVFSKVIKAFKSDWESRTRTSARIISSLLAKSLSLQLVANIALEEDIARKEKELLQRYTKQVMALESQAHGQIRTLFKHNIFNYQLPSHSILQEDLFSEKTWQLLGLTHKQLIILGTVSGAAVGAGIDIAALGHGLGLFTVLGGVIGSIGAFTGRNKLTADASFMGMKIAGQQVQIGPAENISLLFILINRALLYYKYTINWAHGRRDYPTDHQDHADDQQTDISGFTRHWPSSHLKTCHSFFKAIRRSDMSDRQSVEDSLQEMLFSVLMDISRDESER